MGPPAMRLRGAARRRKCRRGGEARIGGQQRTGERKHTTDANVIQARLQEVGHDHARGAHVHEQQQKHRERHVAQGRIDRETDARQGCQIRNRDPRNLAVWCCRTVVWGIARPDRQLASLRRWLKEVQIGTAIERQVGRLPRSEVDEQRLHQHGPLIKPDHQQVVCSQAAVQAVAIDLSAAYILAVSCHLPEAVLIFDHFHIVKLFNDKLSDLRRELHRQACTDNSSRGVQAGSYRTQGCTSQLRELESKRGCATGTLYEHWLVGRCIGREERGQDQTWGIAAEFLLDIGRREPIGKHAESAA